MSMYVSCDKIKVVMNVVALNFPLIKLFLTTTLNISTGFSTNFHVYLIYFTSILPRVDHIYI